MTSAPGYQAPTVTVSSSLPRRGVSDAVLVVGVVTGDSGPVVIGSADFLDADAVTAIESNLRALGASGGEGQVHRLVVPALPVASVLTVGLGKPRDAWPADVIRRAAGAAARSLDKTGVVVTSLSAIDLEAAVEGLILGAYRFNDFRSAKTAPTDAGLKKITALAAIKIRVSPVPSSPVTRGRVCVRGFLASMGRSASRFTAMAKERTATMATVRARKTRQPGQPPAAQSMPR